MPELYLFEQLIKLSLWSIPAYQCPKRYIDPKVVLTVNNEFEPNNILQIVTDIYSYYVPVLCFYVKFNNKW